MTSLKDETINKAGTNLDIILRNINTLIYRMEPDNMSKLAVGIYSESNVIW